MAVKLWLTQDTFPAALLAGHAVIVIWILHLPWEKWKREFSGTTEQEKQSEKEGGKVVGGQVWHSGFRCHFWNCKTTDKRKEAHKSRCDLVYLLRTPALRTRHQRCSRRSCTWGSELGLCRAGSGPSTAHTSFPGCGRRPQDKRPNIDCYTGIAAVQTYLEETENRVETLQHFLTINNL